MVETTSVREENLSARERLKLIQTINALPTTQFDELVFALNPPKGVVSSNSAPQGQRSKELLDWLESSTGPGLAAADEVLQVLIPKATKTAPQSIAFVISGKVSNSTTSELQAYVRLLRKKTGDDSIDIEFYEEGSIKVILNGSSEGLAKLQEIFATGELKQLNIRSVESVTPINSSAQDARKVRLIQAVRLSGQSSTRQKARTLTVIITLILALNNTLESALALNSILKSDIDSTLDSTLDRTLALALHIAHKLTFALDRDRDQRLTRTFAQQFNMDRINRSLDSAAAPDRTPQQSGLIDVPNHNSGRGRDRARAIGYALVDGVAIARKIAHDIAIAIDLSSADLRGANLSYLSLVGANLTNTDLTYADVTGTIFGDNPGLTEADKWNIKSRGAIILDSPSSAVRDLLRL